MPIEGISASNTVKFIIRKITSISDKEVAFRREDCLTHRSGIP